MISRAIPFLQFDQIMYSEAGTTALSQPVSFSLEEGECVGVTGLNSSKTSLLLALAAGLISPKNGQILIEQIPVTASSISIGCLIHPYLPYDSVVVSEPNPPVKNVFYEQQLFLINHASASFCRMSFSKERNEIEWKRLLTSLLAQSELILLEEPLFIPVGFQSGLKESLKLFHQEGRTILFSFSESEKSEACRLADRIICFTEKKQRFLETPLC